MGCFQGMHRLSGCYHCVQLIIALLVSSQTASSYLSNLLQFQLFICEEHYLPELLMSTAYLWIYDGIILSRRRTLPDYHRYLRF